MEVILIAWMSISWVIIVLLVYRVEGVAKKIDQLDTTPKPKDDK